MILVYEFASRGSLDRILDDAALTWTQRLKICLDAAKGLSFLHDPNGSQQRILHRDIKTANILLDENLNAKVSDFGLSKISPANQKYTYLVTNPVGTPGYCDPLYMHTYQLTKESDVYSFGVVLFEFLCGRVCFEYSGRKLKVFVHFWKKCYEQDKLDDITFPDLMPQMEPRSVKTFVDIAYQCLHISHEQRPSMSVVVEKLKISLELQDLRDLKLQREHEQEEMHKAAEYEYGEILKLADPPLIYKSVKELKALLSKGFPVNGGKTLLSINDKGEVICERIYIEACLDQIQYENELKVRQSYVENSRFPGGRSYFKYEEELKVRVRAEFLCPLITYSVNFVFRNAERMRYCKTLHYKVNGEKKCCMVYDTYREDGWFVVPLHQFTSDHKTGDFEIDFEGFQNGCKLQLAGFEFQPLEEKVEHEQVLEDEKLSDNLQWTFNEEDLCTNLLKWFIDNGQEGYAVDNNGKKSLMCSARGAIRSYNMSFQSLPESRFQEVAVITANNFNIVKEIKSDVLLPETTYACYLVYKFTGDQPVLKTPHTKERNYIRGYIYLPSPPKTPIIGQKLDQKTHSPLKRSESIAVPRQRSDGWMEVKVRAIRTPRSKETINIDIFLWNPDWKDISGLMIQSIELRPIVAHSA